MAERTLSPAQREVAELYASDLTAKEIAQQLDKSYHTVRTQLRDVYRLLGVSKRRELREALRGDK